MNEQIVEISYDRNKLVVAKDQQQSWSKYFGT